MTPGLEVVTCDPAPGMKPDVVCFAEDLPFADGSFDLVVTRVAAHHYEDVAKAVAEMARVAADAVLIVDNSFMGDDVEAAEKLRDPSHVRNYSEAEWRSFAETAGLVVEDVQFFEKPIELQPWLDRCGCVERRRGARARAPRRPDRRRSRRARPDRAEGGARLMAIIVDNDTRLVVQGLTGSEGRFHGLRNRAYGTNLVAGVTPGKGGQDVEGVPVLNTVAEAVSEQGANTAMIFVPAPFAADAVYEAVDAGIETVICITEGVPAHDMLRIHTYVHNLGVTLIGPNCPGALSPGKANVGIIPAEIFTAGNIGLVSRSGTLTYQIGHELTQMGLGNSTIVGIGGDPVVGSSFVDILAKFQADPETEYVVMVGEIGGDEEEKAAAFIEAELTKPVVAYIAGFTAPPGKTMGHAGAIISGSSGTAEAKKAALEAKGIRVGTTPTETAEIVAEIARAVGDRSVRLRHWLFDRGDNLAGGIYGTILVTSIIAAADASAHDLALARDRRDHDDRLLARARLRRGARLEHRQRRDVLAARDTARRGARVAPASGGDRSLASRSSPAASASSAPRRRTGSPIGYGVAALIWWGLALRAQGAVSVAGRRSPSSLVNASFGLVIVVLKEFVSH